MVDVFPLQALPIEMQEMIISEILNLPPIEVLKCRSVCNSWKEAIDLLRYDELTIERKANPARSLLHSHRFESMLTNRYLSFRTTAFFEHLPHQPIFENVRKMIVYFETLHDIVSPHLKKFFNHFQLLEDLKIDSPVDFAYFAKMFELNLNLKLLKRLIVTFDFLFFHLKTPKLEFLKQQ